MNPEALGMASGGNGRADLISKKVLNRLGEIQAGQEPEESLVTLDTEFISFSRRILELAFGTFNSGKLLFKAQNDMHHIQVAPDGCACTAWDEPWCLDRRHFYFPTGSQPLSVQLSEHDQVCRWSVQEARDNSASNEKDICLTLFQPYPDFQSFNRDELLVVEYIDPSRGIH